MQPKAAWVYGTNLRARIFANAQPKAVHLRKFMTSGDLASEASGSPLVKIYLRLSFFDDKNCNEQPKAAKKAAEGCSRISSQHPSHSGGLASEASGPPSS